MHPQNGASDSGSNERHSRAAAEQSSTTSSALSSMNSYSSNTNRPQQQQQQPSPMELANHHHHPLLSHQQPPHAHAYDTGVISSSNVPSLPQHEQNQQQQAQQQAHQQPQQQAQQQQAQQQPQQHTTINNHGHHHHRPRQSPNFHPPIRSSPIAIIHNPEDAAHQAKLRWEHPMYYDDTSDDDELMMDEDDDLRGTSVESLTSPHRQAPSYRGPQSLPTALLRAPKLGSLPSHHQDYLLQHLASLPPPMCLNGDIINNLAEPRPGGTISTTTTNMSGSVQDQANAPKNKPKYFSSYGSLRESHLTGRFGNTSSSGGGGGVNKYKYTAGPTAASTGHLHVAAANRTVKVRFHDSSSNNEPPTTLIPPRTPVPMLSLAAAAATATTGESEQLLKNQQEQRLQPSPQPSSPEAQKQPLSIRDRMMQKAQQQKESVQSETSSGSGGGEEKKKAASSLSAMLQASDLNSSAGSAGSDGDYNNNTAIAGTSLHTSHTASLPATSSNHHHVLPASMAQAVAISYNSNMNLFARVQREREAEQQQQGQQGRYSPPPQEQGGEEMLLSSSMTGLEILRAASKARPTRPTSLGILQDSSRSSSSALFRPPPPATVGSNGPSLEQRTFLPLSRTFSEPSPHWEQQQALRFGSMHQSGTMSTATPTPSQVHTSLSSPDLAQEAGAVLHTTDGRTLVPPLRPSSGQQQPQPQPIMTGLSTLMIAQAHSQQAQHVENQPNGNDGGALYAAAAAAQEEPNPDTEVAFEMD